MKRQLFDYLFRFFSYACVFFSLVTLVFLFFHLIKQGSSFLSLEFLSQFSSRLPEKSGIKAGILGSFYVVLIACLICFPLGVSTAIYLSEYAKKNSWFYKILYINISNLAGMPSIIYGLLGLLVFVRFLNLKNSILSGGLTLALLALPIVIITSLESLSAVDSSIKKGAYALGARKWQVTLFQSLPTAFPGILTGFILSVSRILGETAPLIIIGSVTYISFAPESLMSSFTVLPLQIYNWSTKPQESFHQLAASAILVLLILLFLINFISIYLRQKMGKYIER